MSQRFVKGYTDNHLTFVMVDATDFATPESALSAATKIKIYGKLKSATGVNFVSSGTGSLTNDIVHVGASALGIYTIALVKADLSDASAAWYDQYIISLSATGAAYQTLIVDGGIMESYLSAVGSDILSAAVALSGLVSDAHSAAILAASNASEAQSNALLILSRLSDLDSRLASDVSDILSATRGNSDALSDILSRVNSASFLSDIASHVWAAKYTANSAASTFGSLMSDIYSRAGGAVTASDISDIASAVWATALATKLVQLNTSDLSDLRSAIAAGPAATITASDISDIASAVWAAKYTANSAASSFGSMMSDIYSKVTLVQSTASDAHSAAILAASHASDAHSAAVVAQSIGASDMSDLRSAITAVVATVGASDISDIASAVNAILASNLSDILSAAVQTNSRVLVVQSLASDAHSAAVLAQSISASDMSDLRSAITGVTATVSASDISDIASAVRANLGSDLSDILSAAQQANSRVLVVQSLASDAHSAALLAASAASDTYSAITANRAEPAQGAPGASITALAKLDYLYKAWRNRTTQTATQYSLYNDDAVTVDHKATFSDNGTTADRGEVATGP